MQGEQLGVNDAFIWAFVTEILIIIARTGIIVRGQRKNNEFAMILDFKCETIPPRAAYSSRGVLSLKPTRGAWSTEYLVL